MEGSPTFRFRATLWLAEAEAAWVFLTVPEADSEEIRDLVPERRGFGSVRVRVALGATTWTTSVFPDTKRGCYVLPVKKAVRQAEAIAVGDDVSVELELID